MKTRIEKGLLVEEAEKRKMQSSYFFFFKKAWEVLEPSTTLQLNWHIKFLCDIAQKEVERIARKEPKEKDFIINIPPRTLKSYIFSIMLCPWAWTRYPHLRFIYTSYNYDLSTLHSVQSKTIIESDWYTSKWGSSFKLKKDQNEKTYFVNDKNGHRFSTSIGGTVSGYGADIIVVDDPINPTKARSDAHLKEASDHYKTGLYNRINELKIGVRFIVMQRVIDKDLSGILLDNQEGNTEKENVSQNYEHICLPAELRESTEKIISPLYLKDKYRDNLLFPDRLDLKELQRVKSEMSQFWYLAQYLQIPYSSESKIFIRDKFRFYVDPPAKFDFIIESWDLAQKEEDFKGEKGRDFNVGQVWGFKHPNFFLLYQARFKGGFNEQLARYLEVADLYPNTIKSLIEDKVNGSTLIQFLKKSITKIYEFNPGSSSKQERAEVVSGIQHNGRIYLPHTSYFSWVNDFLDRVCAFPDNRKKDDEVDAMVQMLLYVEKNKDKTMRLTDRLRASSEILKGVYK
jgi:predicted phage terminase large subunit-like protein